MKKRLDQLLVEKGLAPDIQTARGIIGAGEVLVDEVVADKAGSSYQQGVTLRVKERCPYVSRGGYKLEKALNTFPVNPEGLCCIDVGASSGGFTDCLLQNGAAKVYAVDVAYGQLDWKLRQDPRVVVIERFNARKITRTEVPDSVQLAVMDTSFISITQLIPPLFGLFDKTIQIVALIKPQFELPREKIAKGGVVRDPELHREAILRIQEFAESIGLVDKGVITSPIKGPKGNTEFLILLESQ
ncbi:TlyA family RNA methyltransferase [Desulfopila sp. IMCC35008]|uniref:TlyA family RNA methyltransferase n=1 Tax=Desulfopila sp. IMCC35008 TaxID=2653858 RepID=UPI0013D15E68|nr:TlyA family RNA methyltransferase [Desulfopila sp. IMCC35008]